jgi:hypothetical protein
MSSLFVAWYWHLTVDIPLFLCSLPCWMVTGSQLTNLPRWPSYVSMQTEQRMQLPRIPPFLSDMLHSLLPSDGPGTVDAGACFGCHGNVFTSCWLTMDDFSGPAIMAFSRHVTILYCIGTVSISDSVVLMVGWLVNNELERFQKEAVEAWFEVLSWHLTGGTGKLWRTLVAAEDL